MVMSRSNWIERSGNLAKSGSELQYQSGLIWPKQLLLFNKWFMPIRAFTILYSTTHAVWLSHAPPASSSNALCITMTIIQRKTHLNASMIQSSSS
jgi:hypothetical protein